VSASPREYIKKVCLLGDGGVGKTSLVRRFVFSEFQDKYLETIGAKVTKKVIQVKRRDNEPVKLTMMLHDIAGQVKFESVHRLYYQGAAGALIVCDLTRNETLLNVRRWVESLRAAAGEVPVILLANKADLADRREFGEDAIDRITTRMGAPFYLTSAKSGQNVEEAFHEIGRRVCE
jgi:small GTP-binding protein